MTKCEKTMKGLACHVDSDTCDSCPYKNDIAFNQSCTNKLICDTLILLKEQEKQLKKQEKQLKEWEKHVPFLAAHGILKGDEDDG